jgi:hypothetical protein
MALVAGDRLGPYEVLALLGAGGMGEVYRSRDPRLGREVAVKVLPAAFSKDPVRLQRFEQEARSVGRQPANFEIDLHVSYPIRLGKTARLQLQADAFNLLDRQAVLRYDERYNLIQDGPCAGVPEGLCTEESGLLTHPGTLEPVGSIGDPRLTATNPDYLRKGVAFTGQRSVRLGARLSF